MNAFDQPNPEQIQSMLQGLSDLMPPSDKDEYVRHALAPLADQHETAREVHLKAAVDYVTDQYGHRDASYIEGTLLSTKSRLDTTFSRSLDTLSLIQTAAQSAGMRIWVTKDQTPYPVQDMFSSLLGQPRIREISPEYADFSTQAATWIKRRRSQTEATALGEVKTLLGMQPTATDYEDVKSLVAAGVDEEYLLQLPHLEEIVRRPVKSMMGRLAIGNRKRSLEDSTFKDNFEKLVALKGIIRELPTGSYNFTATLSADTKDVIDALLKSRGYMTVKEKQAAIDQIIDVVVKEPGSAQELDALRRQAQGYMEDFQAQTHEYQNYGEQNSERQNRNRQQSATRPQRGPVFSPEVVNLIDTQINRFRAQGMTNKQIKRKLVTMYHPDRNTQSNAGEKLRYVIHLLDN